MVTHLLPEGHDLPRELVQFTVDRTLPRYKEGDGMVDWWGHVFDQAGKYPALGALAKCCLSIFHGPRVESSFSLMNEIIDERSGNMNIETLDAIQTVKYALQSRGQTAVQMFERSDDKFGEVDRVLCRNISNAAARYSKAKKERQLQHQGDARSAQQAKKEAAESNMVQLRLVQLIPLRPFLLTRPPSQ